MGGILTPPEKKSHFFFLLLDALQRLLQMLVDVWDACPKKSCRFGLRVAFEFHKAVDLTLDICQEPQDAPDHFFLGFQIRIHICAGLGGDAAFVETAVVAVVTAI